MSKRELPYNNKSPEDIERYAKNLRGKTFYDVLAENLSDVKLDESVEYYNNPYSKGGLGTLLEKHYFYYSPNSNPEPDFADAGVELKVTPYEISKRGKYTAGERLVLTMISNNKPIEENFYESELFEKIKLILLILYKRIRGQARTEFSIDYVALFSILSTACKEDLQIILEDYSIITRKIIAGKAHELSEGDTRYLGACTKGATAKSSLQPQYYNPDIPAKRRAFSLKQSYMSYVINHYILNNIETFDSAFSAQDLISNSFEQKVIDTIEEFKGLSETELFERFEITSSAKHKNCLLVARLLGVKTDGIAEFEKADIQVKTIRVKQNGTPRESMSFPAMSILEFVQEDFEESAVYKYFSEKRFLFVVFREGIDNRYYLSGAKFWNMPISELESSGKSEWLAYQKKFLDGVNFTVEEYQSNQTKGRIYIRNDLPKQSETMLFHLRPHSRKSAYLIDGVKYGSGNENDMDELPDGNKMTKQSFWLNQKYIADIIKDI